MITQYMAKEKKSFRYLSFLNHPSNKGFCPICNQTTIFIEYGSWLRDQYKCIKCDSIPRNRALINTIKLFVPDYKQILIHESSPGSKSSYYLKKECQGYSCSHYFPEVSLGKTYKGFRCENLESLTFSDESFDLFITQDVFEHILHPDKAFKEIARVLKPGGMHIFTMPWYPELKDSRQRAAIKDGEIDYLEEAIYHGNPISKQGSLVTYDWGADFVDYVYKHSGMSTTIYLHRDRSLGLDARHLQVFISKKSYE